MADSKHTPGPWGLTTRRGSWDWVVYQAADPNHEICQPFHDGTEENELGEANARLIAAAPDLKGFADKLLIYRVEGDEDHIRLRFDFGAEIVVPINSPQGCTLLAIEAVRSRAIAKATGALTSGEREGGK